MAISTKTTKEEKDLDKDKYREYDLDTMESEFLFPNTIGIDLIDSVENGNALDIGFGNGKKTLELSKKVGNVFAIDIQDQMLKYADKNYSSDNIQYHVDNILNIDLPENHYDVIHSQFVFFYILDKRKLFERIYNSLKRGGQFVFVDLTCHSNNPPIDNECQRIPALWYSEMLTEIGFSNVVFVKEENLMFNGEYSGQYCSTFKCSK